MKKNQSQIKNLAQLKRLTKDKTKIFHIRLIGWVRSIKIIKFNTRLNRFSIFNEMNNTRQLLTPEEMMDRHFTNIGEAINKRAFYSN